MERVNVVAIDGPAGSGKSTVAREIARRLGFFYIDTGAMYRALTLKALRLGIDLGDKKALVELSGNTEIELDESGASLKVRLDGKDVTEDIRTMEVTTSVKYLASIGRVRENMVKLQRKLASLKSGAVLEGRDIGTVVFPDAAHKFYLDASVETRVKRRFDELKEKGMEVLLSEIEDDVKSRDTTDMTRKVGPLKKAEGAGVIDTTGMTAIQVVERILRLLPKT